MNHEPACMFVCVLTVCFESFFWSVLADGYVFESEYLCQPSAVLAASIFACENIWPTTTSRQQFKNLITHSLTFKTAHFFFSSPFSLSPHAFPPNHHTGRMLPLPSTPPPPLQRMLPPRAITAWTGSASLSKKTRRWPVPRRKAKGTHTRPPATTHNLHLPSKMNQ